MAHDTAVFGTLREQEEMLASRSNLTRDGTLARRKPLGFGPSG